MSVPNLVLKWMGLGMGRFRHLCLEHLIPRILDRRYLKWLPPERRELVLAKHRGRAKGMQGLKDFGIL